MTKTGHTDLSTIALDTLPNALILDIPLNPTFPSTIKSAFSLLAESIIASAIDSPLLTTT
jgi:hypothetical protein